MDILLLAFALPVSTILLAIVLQKVLNCPLLVAASFFGVLLIATYVAFDSSFLVFAIIYTILAYITAVVTKIVCCFITRINTSNISLNNTNVSNNTLNENGTNQLNCKINYYPKCRYR